MSEDNFSGSSASNHAKVDPKKVIAQNKELRRLLADEQRKVKAADEERKKKDQELRRTESELDGFRFRNDQLLKRIEFLQHEMSSSLGPPSSANTKKSQKNNNEKVVDPIVEQELMKRIQENCDLRNRLESAEQSLKEERDVNLKKIGLLENALSQSEAKHQKSTTSIRQERNELQVKVGELERKLEHFVGDKDSTIEMLETKIQSLESKIEQMKQEKGGALANQSLLLDPFCPPEYSRLNLAHTAAETALGVASRQRSKSVASLVTNGDNLLLSLSSYGAAVISIVHKSGVNSVSISGVINNAKSCLANVTKKELNYIETMNHCTSSLRELYSLMKQFLSLSDASLQASSSGILETLEKLCNLAKETCSLLESNPTPSVASEWLKYAHIASSASGCCHDHYSSLVIAFVGKTDVKTSVDAALQALAGLFTSSFLPFIIYSF